MKSDTSEIHRIKCIVCLTMNEKDMILGSKFNTFEKHARKMKMVSDIPHLGKKQGKFYVNKKCNHVKIKVIYFQCSHMKIVEQVI